MELKFEKYLDVSKLLIDVNSIKDYICTLCKGIIKQPRQDTCGHIFCKACIIHYSNTYPNTCPITNANYGKNELSEIKFVENILNKILTKCKHDNCDWSGMLQDLDFHIQNECSERTVNCSNQGCLYQGKYSKIKEHHSDCLYREVVCELCREPYKFTFNHMLVCKNSLVYCEKHCGERIKKDEEEEHFRTRCEMAEIECPFQRYGCNAVFIRKDMKYHLTGCNDNHLMLILQTFEEQNEKIKKLEQFKEEQLTKTREVETFMKKQKVDAMKNIFISIENGKSNGNEVLLGKKVNRIIDDSEEKVEKIDSEKDNKKEISSTKSIKNKSSPSIIPATQNELKKYTFTFDTNYSFNKGVKIENNRIIVMSNSKSRTAHRFVFANLNVSSVEASWKITVKKISNWFGFGLCQKEKVIKNKLIFYNGTEFDHGIFCFSSNGYSWNGNYSAEDNLAIKDFKQIRLNDTILVHFKPKTSMMSIKINEYTGKIRNVSGDGYSLVPCFIFLNGEDEIVVEMI
jgi:hypothetical protein